jgi:hypothetical protein
MRSSGVSLTAPQAHPTPQLSKKGDWGIYLPTALPPNTISSQPVHQVPPTWPNHTSRYKELDAHQDDPSTPPANTSGKDEALPAAGQHHPRPEISCFPSITTHHGRHRSNAVLGAHKGWSLPFPSPHAFGSLFLTRATSCSSHSATQTLCQVLEGTQTTRSWLPSFLARRPPRSHLRFTSFDPRALSRGPIRVR